MPSTWHRAPDLGAQGNRERRKHDQGRSTNRAPGVGRRDVVGGVVEHVGVHAGDRKRELVLSIAVAVDVVVLSRDRLAEALYGLAERVGERSAHTHTIAVAAVGFTGHAQSMQLGKRRKAKPPHLGLGDQEQGARTFPGRKAPTVGQRHHASRFVERLEHVGVDERIRARDDARVGVVGRQEGMSGLHGCRRRGIALHDRADSEFEPVGECPVDLRADADPVRFREGVTRLG